MATSAGSLTFILLATSPIALMKQADQPAANNCSGLVPVPGTPGAENLTSKRPSSLREMPPRRPPEVWVLAVYCTYLHRSPWGLRTTRSRSDRGRSAPGPAPDAPRQDPGNRSAIAPGYERCCPNRLFRAGVHQSPPNA